MASRGTIAEISLGAISSNLDKVRLKVGKRKILAVIKASAYGHGAVAVAKILISKGVDMFGVATVGEGIELRDAGITHNIIVLSGITPDEVDELLNYNLTPVIYNPSIAKYISEESRKKDRVTGIHIKVDTGMGRLGIIAEESADIIKKITELKCLRPEGIMTHFADADLSDKEYARFQLKRFNDAIDGLKRFGINIPLVHAANSAAILTFGQSYFDMVRPGIMLYGYTPSDHIDNADLIPALTLKTKILDLKRVPAGTPISYGKTFVTKRDSVISILPIGYADGYSRMLSNRGEVLVRGRRAPVVGRVCMDMTMADVTDIPDVDEGNEAVLIGKQGRELITADDVAKWTGTIPYEVLCSISSRVQRVYKE
ncbi:MAG: alanine racemase [Nitrospirota bacterium]